MRAAIKTAHGDFTIQDVAMPRIPHPDWVLAQVKVAGICGTDLRHWKVADPHLEGRVVGHELAGEVVEVGEAVTHLTRGDRVVIETVLGDDRCEWCRIAQYNLCPHLYEVRAESVSRAFAEYVVGPAAKFYKLPDHVSFEEAALLDTFAVSLHALHVGGVKMNDTVAIIGAGPIKLALLELAKLSGARAIITDVLDSPLQLATRLGADATVNTKMHDGGENVNEFTHHRGVDIAFECAGGGRHAHYAAASHGLRANRRERRARRRLRCRAHGLYAGLAAYSKSGNSPHPQRKLFLLGTSSGMLICLDLLAA